MSRFFEKTVIFFIVCYQRILAPFLLPRCKFFPSCSHYMIDSIKIKGLIKGIAYGLLRIVRCNPFSKGGYDPVKLKK